MRNCPNCYYKEEYKFDPGSDICKECIHKKTWSECINCHKSVLVVELITNRCVSCIKVKRHNYAVNYYIKKSKKYLWISKLKATLTCKVCKESDPVVLEFHHRDPSQKHKAISAMQSANESEIEIRKEIKKCDVLCSNCHKRHHHHLRSQKLSYEGNTNT